MPDRAANDRAMSGHEGQKRLNPRQEKFVEHVYTTPTITMAAVLAGYSEKSATRQATRLMGNAEVLRELARLRALHRLNYRIVRDDIHDKLELAYQGAFEQKQFGTCVKAAMAQANLDYLLPIGGRATKLSPEDSQRLADQVAESAVQRGVDFTINPEGARRWHDQQIEVQRRLEREARIAVTEKHRKRINDGKETFNLEAFEPTQDEIDRDNEGNGEIERLKALPGATWGPLEPRPRVVETEWTPPQSVAAPLHGAEAAPSECPEMSGNDIDSRATTAADAAPRPNAEVGGGEPTPAAECPEMSGNDHDSRWPGPGVTPPSSAVGMVGDGPAGADSKRGVDDEPGGFPRRQIA